MDQDDYQFILPELTLGGFVIVDHFTEHPRKIPFVELCKAMRQECLYFLRFKITPAA